MPINDPIKQKEASRRHYVANRDKVIAKAKEYSVKARVRIRAFITAHLKANPCVDCGETDTIVLEFDHLKDKDFNLSDAARKGVSIKKLNAEIAKCEVRCANCHRRKTYERSGLTHKN
jgi:5-methylcytosine-specific restriction endonuclease McrA